MKDYCCEPVETLEQVKSDCQMVQLGYKCKGKLIDRPLYNRRQVHERLWLWEKENHPPVVTYDKGNHWCEVVPLKAAADLHLWNTRLASQAGYDSVEEFLESFNIHEDS